MRFRMAALGLHLLASFLVLTVILGGLYLGWYGWPGWYLADVARVSAVLAGVDVVAGPLLTFVIASPGKPRRVLARDVAVIATVQLCALAYGTVALWNGRPLYYAFSEGVLSLVQAYDIDAAEMTRARQENAPLIPHWYSLPRWIFVPLPQDSNEQNRIIASAITGGADVIAMPRYYRPWQAGLPALRTALKKVADLKFFSGAEKQLLAARMQSAHLDPTAANCLAFTGRGRPLLAVYDPSSLALQAILAAR